MRAHERFAAAKRQVDAKLDRAARDGRDLAPDADSDERGLLDAYHTRQRAEETRTTGPVF